MNKLKKQLEEAIELGKRWLDYGYEVTGLNDYKHGDLNVSIYRASFTNHTAVKFGSLEIDYFNPVQVAFRITDIDKIGEFIEKATSKLEALEAEQEAKSLEEKNTEKKILKARLQKQLDELK